MKTKRISLRINEEQFERIAKMLGLDKSVYGRDTKVIESCLNLAENVIQRQFGGDLQHIFKRKPTDIKEGFYENTTKKE